MSGPHPLVVAMKPVLDAVGAQLIHPDHRLPSDIPRLKATLGDTGEIGREAT